MTANLFRMPDGRLDRMYLRTCAIWRLLRADRITVDQAKELANRRMRRCWQRPGWLNNTIEIWVKARHVGPDRRRHED